MDQATPFAITISRQFGSGGAYIGQHIAKELNMYYADHDIISKAAKRLSVLEEDLDSRDEKIQTLWKSFLEYSALSSDVYMPPKMIMPTARQLFETESEIIEHIAKEHSAVIIGRCGFHILRNHPNHVSIYLHGNLIFRCRRIQEVYEVSEQVALNIIAKKDKERSHFIKTFSDYKWPDATQFDLSIDTSKMGVDNSVALILSYLKLI